MLTIYKWNASQQEELSESVIRNLYQPAANYSISHNTYPSGTKITGTSQAGTCYILSGKCKLKYARENGNFMLIAGDYVEFPEGGFELTVLGNQEAKVVEVLVQPEKVGKRNRE